jgi:hypothetical protein
VRGTPDDPKSGGSSGRYPTDHWVVPFEVR